VPRRGLRLHSYEPLVCIDLTYLHIRLYYLQIGLKCILVLYDDSDNGFKVFEAVEGKVIDLQSLHESFQFATVVD
jgi:hypothetical protein